MTDPEENGRIGRWSGEFVDPVMERRFLRHHLRTSRAELRLALVVAALMFPAFGFSDVALLGPDHPSLPWLFAIRALVAVGAIWLFGWITLRPGVVLRLLPLNLWIVTGVATIIAIVPLRDAFFGTQLPAVIVATVAIYLFIPNRMDMRLLHSGVLAVGFLLAISRLEDAPPMFSQSLLLLFVNLVGYLSARRLSRLSRQQFSLLWESRRANRVLKAEIHERERVQAHLDYLVGHDELTGLPNRRQFFEVASQRLADPATRPLAVLMIDIDHFKRINDEHGHAAGDAVLARVGALFGEMVRSRGLVARLGGEEFAALLEHCPVESACELAEDWRRRLAAESIETPAGPLRIDLTIGVTAIRDEEGGIDPALGRADRALYEGKRAGRGQVRLSARSA
ncbi:MAG: GGDEF domain-containing protein [Pseudomonadota bacterium]